ncbi:MAG: hypothetical protein AMXMBFR13_03310 [Phycisphaerae bacterium]
MRRIVKRVIPVAMTLGLAIPVLAGDQSDYESWSDRSSGYGNSSGYDSQSDRSSSYGSRSDRSSDSASRWDRSDSSRQSSRDFSDSSRQRSGQADRSRSRRSQSQRGQSDWQLEPVGWVRIAYDFDQDGSFDAYEYIYSYDLERARRSSQERDQQGMARSDQGRFRDQQSQTGQLRGQAVGRDRGQQQHRVSGEIINLKTINLAGFENAHQIAKIETNDGRVAKIDLGPKQDLNRLDLQTGDRITVFGRPGRINDRTMLMASRVQSDQGKTVSVDRQRTTSQNRNLRRFTGEVLSTRTANIRGEQHLLARVQLDRGRTTTVDLGQRQDLRNVDISSGDRISLLARQGRINDQPGLFAVQFRANGRLIEVDRSDMSGGQARMQQRW